MISSTRTLYFVEIGFVEMCDRGEGDEFLAKVNVPIRLFSCKINCVLASGNTGFLQVEKLQDAGKASELNSG